MRTHTTKSRLDMCFYWVEKFGSFCIILVSYNQENKKKEVMDKIVLENEVIISNSVYLFFIFYR